MPNSYGHLVEKWKVDLILERARRKRFRRDEMEDVQQELIQAVIDFQYDPQKSNGASEATALTALIDKRLAFIQRGQARLRKREKKYRKLHGCRDGAPPEDLPDPADEDAAVRSRDVQDAVARLAPTEQLVCAALARGEPHSVIASTLGVTRYEVGRIIQHIREQLKTWGLEGWVNDR
jgi:hypothetical protein